MTTVGTAANVTFPAWQGWIRWDAGLSDTPRQPDPGRVEIGPAVFSLPDSAEAPTTSWTRQEHRFCVFSGYLYNRAELASELSSQRAPEPPTTAELTLAAYGRWGDQALLKLEGSFAVAVWDQSRKTLWCGRDAAGLHPFFYAVAGRDLIFSWDFRTVRRHPLVSRDLNPVALAEHLIHKWSDAHETFFRAIRRLPGAHGLRWAGGQTQVFRYWQPTPAAGPIRWATAEEVGQFPALFRQAVEGVMQCGGGRAGILLSGGLDSVSVAACAADIAAERGWPAPRAFSVNFPGAACEEPVQKAVAERLGLPQTWVEAGDYLERRPGLLRRALDLAPCYPSPPSFTSAAAFLDLMRHAADQGCAVMLTGDGGDEVLGVTPAYAADLIRSGRWLELARSVRLLARYWDGSALVSMRNMLWTHGTRALLRDWVWKQAPGLALLRRRQLMPLAIPDWVAPDPAIRAELVARYEQRWERDIAQGSFYLSYLDRGSVHPIPHMSFEEQFYRNCALAGVPTLHPYWNRPLADLLLRTPPQLLNRGGRWKGLVRPVVESRFPNLGFDRQKKRITYDFPKEVFRREGPLLLQELGGAGAMAELGLVDPHRYHAVLEQSLGSQEILHLYRVWHGAGAETWVRCHR